MKTSMKTWIVAATIVTLSPLHAAESNVQAAVVAKETNAEVRKSAEMRAEGRRNLEVGEVYEVGSPNGRFLELKIDADHVALVPSDSLKIRSCSRTELGQVQAKFNKALSSESQSEARQAIAKTMRNAKSQEKAVAAQQASQAAAAKCSTCPMVRASAANAGSSQSVGSAARDAYIQQKKVMRDRNDALAKQALAWADSGPSASEAVADNPSFASTSGLLIASSTWKNTEGKEIHAAVKSANSTHVVFLMGSKEVTYALADLSEESRNAISLLAK